MAAAHKSLENGENRARSSGEYSFGEKESAPVALSKGIWICGPGPYENTLSKTTEDPWKGCHDVVDMNDREFCKQLSKEISWLLIVASLFLGIITAFTNTSLRWLQANPEETMVELLRDVVQLLNNPGSQIMVPPPRPFVPKNHYIVINQLWFLSMTLSISAVVVGTLCLQWIAAFRRADVKNMPHEDALALRQLRFDGLMTWGVPLVPAALLVVVQSALVLFAIGLLYLLWSVNRRVALPVAVVSGVSVIILALTTTTPLLQSVVGWMLPRTLTVPQCPYKSPISWAVHRLCVLLVTTCSFPFVLLSDAKSVISKWHRDQLKLLPDFLWQEYDELWRRQRERRGPQSSKTKGYSYYLVHGLASAMEALVFRNAVHIIHGCLQDFHGTEAEVETFKELFPVDLNRAEEDLLQDTVPTPLDNPAVNPSTSERVHLRRDFLNAHALQDFVKHNQKLHRTLLRHRIELYVRIKNTSLSNESAGSRNQLIGSSIECPIQSLHDAQQLSAESQIQFLYCARHMLCAKGMEDKDIPASAIGYVLKAAKSQPPTLQNKGSNQLSQFNPSPPPAQSQPSATFDGGQITEEPVSSVRPNHERHSTTTTLVNTLNVTQSTRDELIEEVQALLQARFPTQSCDETSKV